MHCIGVGNKKLLKEADIVVESTAELVGLMEVPPLYQKN
jgi:hypothetical protein